MVLNRLGGARWLHAVRRPTVYHARPRLAGWKRRGTEIWRKAPLRQQPHSTAPAFQSPSESPAAALTLLERVRPYAPYILHVGNTCALAGFAMHDVLHLRSLAMMAAGCGIVFNVTHLPPLKLSCAWNVLFLAMNGYMTVMLLVERNTEIRFTPDEYSVFEEHFMPHGVTPLQCGKLLGAAKWVEYKPGSVIAREGENLKSVILVVQGRVEASVADGVTVQVLSHASADAAAAWIGEMHFLEADKARGSVATFTAKAPTRVLRWDVKRLRHLMQEDPEFASCVQKAITGALVGKVLRFAAETEKQSNESYKHVLEAVLADSIIDPAEKRLVREYREKYHVSDEVHRRMLGELGWTPEEFEDGSKHETQEVAAAASRIKASLQRISTVKGERRGPGD